MPHLSESRLIHRGISGDPLKYPSGEVLTIFTSFLLGVSHSVVSAALEAKWRKVNTGQDPAMGLADLVPSWITGGRTESDESIHVYPQRWFHRYWNLVGDIYTNPA